MKFFSVQNSKSIFLLQHPTYGKKGKIKAKKMEDFVLFVDNFESLATFGGVLDNLPIAMIQNDSNKVEKILNIIRSTLELLCKSFEKLPLGWQR